MAKFGYRSNVTKRKNMRKYPPLSEKLVENEPFEIRHFVQMASAIVDYCNKKQKIPPVFRLNGAFIAMAIAANLCCGGGVGHVRNVPLSFFTYNELDDAKQGYPIRKLALDALNELPNVNAFYYYADRVGPQIEAIDDDVPIKMCQEWQTTRHKGHFYIANKINGFVREWKLRNNGFWWAPTQKIIRNRLKYGLDANNRCFSAVIVWEPDID